MSVDHRNFENYTELGEKAKMTGSDFIEMSRGWYDGLIIAK